MFRLKILTSTVLSAGMMAASVMAQETRQNVVLNSASEVAGEMDGAASAQKLPVKFAKGVPYPSGSSTPLAVAVGDVNGDGHADLVVANNCDANCQQGSVGILLGKGDGTFQSVVSYSSGGYGAHAVAIGDVNHDGKLDVLVANFCGPVPCGGGSLMGVSVLLGNGDGSFQTAVNYSSGGYEADAIAIADVNGDGKADIVVGNCSSGNAGTCDSGSVGILLGNGNGTFQAPVVYASGGAGATSVAVGDVNGDGKLDLVVANCSESGELCGAEATNGSIGVLLGNGNGTFQAAVNYSTGYLAQSVALGDLNGDGHPDVVVAAGYAGVLIGNGDGTFQPVVNYKSGGFSPESVAVSDVNGDARPDVVVVSRCWNPQTCHFGAVGVLAGLGDGTLQDAVRYSSEGSGAFGVGIGDMNGDGRIDLAAASFTVAVFLNKLSATTTLQLTSSLNPSQVNQSVTFTASVNSQSPLPDGSLIAFYSGGTQIGTGKTASGVASLTTSFSAAGKYTIQAVYAGDAYHKKSSKKVKQVVNP